MAGGWRWRTASLVEAEREKPEERGVAAGKRCLGGGEVVADGERRRFRRCRRWSKREKGMKAYGWGWSALGEREREREEKSEVKWNARHRKE